MPRRARRLDAHVEHRLNLHSLARDAVAEGLALQQFHGDEGSPIGLVNLVDGADVRVVQRGRSLGLPLETAESLCIVGKVVGKELQGDVATELQVFRLVHHTHAPATDLEEYAVMGDGLPNGLGGRGHWLDMLGGDEGEVKRRGSGGETVASQCIAGKASFNPPPNRIAGSASRSECIPGREMPRECPPAFRSARAVTGTDSAKRRSARLPSAIAQSAAIFGVALR